MGGREITAELADFIERTQISQIPESTVQKAKTLVIDLLGVATGGSKEEAARIVQGLIEEQGLKGNATVIGSAYKSNPTWSALANGIAGHALDYDDVSQPMYGHPTVAVLPAALALGEVLDVDGSKLLESYIIGVEVAVKLSRGMNPAHYEHGWHATCTLGSIGAAAASAKLLGLTGERLRAALAVAASEACGLQQNFGTMTKPFHAGRAAENGVLAALLAQKGWTGYQDILEAPLGFFQVFCGTGNYDPEKVVDRLGNPFDIEEPGVILKKYPSCAFSHPVIDAGLTITQDPSYNPDQVEKVEGHVHKLANQILIYSNPQTGLEAKFSMEACLALALVDRKVNMKSFSEDAIDRGSFRGMLSRIERIIASTDNMRTDDFGPAKVKVFMRDGGVLEATVRKAKGNPENPMSRQEIQEKYTDCCAEVLPDEYIDRSLSLLENLEKLPRLGELMGCYWLTI
jgi:2-methylcitrate dehydratase PrpD